MDEFEPNLDNIQQNINTNLIINTDDIDIELKALPFTFYDEQTPKLNYNNNGNKIICPKYILYELSKYENIAYPITFKFNDTYLGVLEFKEFIDEIYVPNHIFYNLNLIENEHIQLKILHTPLPKATYIKIKPHCDSFYKIEDKKKYLEAHLKNLFTILSENTKINLIYGNSSISLSILECKPNKHVSLDEIEELEIDIEPLIKPKPKIIASLNTSLNNKKSKNSDGDDVATNDTNTFKSFSGTCNKLGSK